MVKQSEKRQMLEYIVSRLEGTHENIVPVSKEVVSGIVSNYVLTGSDEVVLMVDGVYPRDSFERLYSSAKKSKRNVAAVVLKDGETFFRNASERNYFKKDKFLSLKNYSNEELRRMILFRPEEIFLSEINSGWIQYYQPESAKLEEGIESFKFVPVEFDYSHIDSYERFKPQDTSSKRLHVWKDRLHFTEPLIVKGRFLKRRQ